MRTMFLILLVIALLSSCPESRFYNVLSDSDRTPPVEISHKLRTNKLFRVVYDEEVVIDEVVFNGSNVRVSLSGTVIDITLPTELKSGEKASLSVTAEDFYGNTTRSSYVLTGINDNLPDAVINEVSPDGTSTSPDRVEILFLSSGSTAGMALADGTPDNHYYSYTLETKDVSKNDIFLIYWNTNTSETLYDNDLGGITWVFSAGSPKTLISTKGALILYESEDGDIMDGIIYTDETSDKNNGYGNSITEDSAYLLMKSGQWSGDSVSSAYITSSRVLARLPDGTDTNTAKDFFTTEAKGSTFGGGNNYVPYTVT